MSFFELIEFTLRFNFSAPDKSTWIYICLILIFFVFFMGWAWGKMWNREWSMSGHIGTVLIVLAFGVLAGYSVFNLRGVGRMEGWFQQQRLTLARSIVDSGRFNRMVLTSTWDKLTSKGGQDGISPPLEGGTEIRLNTPEDALTLATTAAEETRSILRNKLPFSLGVPVSTRNPSDIATEAVDAVRFDSTRFPTIAGATNEWSGTAATLQANHALETAYVSIKPRIDDLKMASWAMLITSLIIPIFLVPVIAVGDIKINPKP